MEVEGVSGECPAGFGDGLEGEGKECLIVGLKLQLSVGGKKLAVAV